VRLDAVTFRDLEVIDYVNTNLKAVKMHQDSVEGKVLIKYYKISGYPTIVFVNSDSVEIDRIIGYLPPEKFLEEIQRIQRGENTIADYIKKTTQNPDDFDSWKLLAEKYENRGNLTFAVKVWETVAKAKIGDQILTNYKLIELSARINREVSGLEKFVASNFDSKYTPNAFKNIIKIQRYLKNTDAEAKSWKKYLYYIELMEKQTASFYNSFAWRMGQLDQNLGFALERIRAGIDMIPDDDSSTLAGLMDTEAEILWKLGNIEDAVKIIDECILLKPGDKYLQNQREKFLEN